MIRTFGDLLRHVVEVGHDLTLDKALGEHLLAKVDRIESNCIGQLGQLQEWVRELDDTSKRRRDAS